MGFICRVLWIILSVIRNILRYLPQTKKIQVPHLPPPREFWLPPVVIHCWPSMCLFKVILRQFEVVFRCLEWECCTFQKIDENSFKSTDTMTVFTRRQSAIYFESWFEMRILNHDSKYGIFDRVYAKSRWDLWFEMRISNHGPEVFSSYESQITNLDVIWHTHGPKYRISNRDSRCALKIWHFAVLWKQSIYICKHCISSLNSSLK